MLSIRAHAPNVLQEPTVLMKCKQPQRPVYQISFAQRTAFSQYFAHMAHIKRDHCVQHAPKENGAGKV